MESQGFARFFGFCESLRIRMGFAILRIPCESMDSLRTRKTMDLCESRSDSCESKHPLDSLSSRVRLLSESKISLDSHSMRILRILDQSYLKHANPGQQDSQILRTLDSHYTRIRMRITIRIMYKLFFIIIVLSRNNKFYELNKLIEFAISSVNVTTKRYEIWSGFIMKAKL